MKKKILVLGSAGMLGHVVCKYLEELNQYQIFDASFRNKFRNESNLINILDKDKLTDLIEKISPDIVINCIGVLIKGSNTDKANAIYINSYFPHFLSDLIQKMNGRLIHVSTDCVFSGAKGGYSEFDSSDAVDIYGKTKSLGEVNNKNDLTFRTSIIGPELKMQGEGLFHWLMNQTGSIHGFTKVFWSGVTTLELARAIHAAIEENLTGLINISAKQKISKCDLLKKITNIYTLQNVKIIASDDKIVDKSLISVRNDFNFKVKSYDKMLLDLYEFMNQNNELYGHYFSNK